jgi:cyclopropane fatty-acyl-phospholipid synthase-like methyltransferase
LLEYRSDDVHMGTGPSPRLLAIVDALPLRKGMRVLEVGCGPGAAAREIARRIGRGHVLGIDRSATAIAQAKAGSRAEISRNVHIGPLEVAATTSAIVQTVG